MGGGTGAGAGAGAEGETEAAPAALQSGQSLTDQHRVALMEAHPHVDVTQRY